MKIDGGLKYKLIDYFESEEGPIFVLYDNGDIGAFDDGDLSYPDTLDLVRDDSIPLEDLGEAGDHPAIRIYRELRRAEEIE